MSALRAGGRVGPLEPFRDGFRAFLVAEGYASKSIELRLALFSHVSRWMGERGLAPSELTAVDDEFFTERRRRYTWFTTTRSLAPLGRYLGAIGVVSAQAAAPASQSPVEGLIERYRRHLERERGLAAGSIELYLAQVRRLVAAWWPSGEVRAGELDAAGIIAMVRREAARSGWAKTKTVTCALRSFLRFLHAAGLTERSFAEAVPSLPDRRRESIPRYLQPDVLAALFASCDLATVAGRRDLAVLRLLSRLGLRSGEVAAVSLDDLDWDAGEIVVVGKSRRRERMPLPVEVGEAIVAYLLDGRPQSNQRAVFLGLDAPHAPLSRCGVKSIVYHCCDRAVMPRVGPHRLRHTVATETLRAGGSLTEVAQLLRHRWVETTATYAKVDHGSLRALALPWPGASA
jgi:site-specific recombinase XerD